MIRRPASLRDIVFLGGMLAMLGLLTYSYYYYYAPGPLAVRQTVLFKKGMGFRAIVDKMANYGVIDHPWLFKVMAVVLGDARKFKAGEYEFSAAINPRLVMSMIAEGRVVVHKITMPEGMNVRQVVAMLNAQELLEGVIVARIDEGSLLPQTYHYVYGDQRQDLIDRMQAGMKTTMAELWEKRAKNLPYTTQTEALTLASIVEKETNLASEYGRVAAVYINRLRKGMRLQADPTVIYGVELNNDGAPIGRPLSGTDLRTPSPYNTYVNYGLPPTPIANPGRAAIAATLNPPSTNELYFVATGTGGHNFSATLDAHNKSVANYRTELKKQQQQKKQ